MLSLPNTYSSNLGQHIQEDYLVRIYNEDGNYLAVGTSEQTVGGVTYIGAITNAPSIREGIDLVKGTASLSNISISFSNFSFTSNGTVTLGSSTPIEEELFFGTNFYINRDVEVYSQLEGDSNASNLLLLFKGRLRAVQLSENKITLQVTAHRPLQDIMIPQTISESGLYKPIVFGDYASAGTSFPLQSLLGATARTYPVQVEKIQSGNVFCLTASAGNNSNKTLHVHESGLSPEGSGTLVENMAACSAVETAASSADASPIITKQSGSDNLFAVGTDVDLSRIFKSEMMIKSTDYTITNKYTPSASINISSSTNNSLEVDVNKLKISLKKVDRLLDYEFIQEYGKNYDRGKNMIIYKVLKNTIKKLIQADINKINKGIKLKIIDIESKLEIDLVTKKTKIKYKLKGTVDRIQSENGDVKIIDYKTGSFEPYKLSFGSYQDLIDKKKKEGFQLLCYCLMYTYNNKNPQSLNAGIISFKNLNSGLISLKKSKTENYNQEELDKFKTVLDNVIEEIFDSNLSFSEN